MSSLYEYHEGPYNGGNGNSISSIDEYLDRVNKMHRAPTMIQDFSRGAHTHPPHHNKSSSYPDHRSYNDQHIKIHNNHQPKAPEVNVIHKKVHFTEYEERVDIDRRGKNEVCEERTIDMEADGFIQRRHKNFDSCNTFKGY